MIVEMTPEQLFAKKQYSKLKSLGLTEVEQHRVLDAASLTYVDSSLFLFRKVRELKMDPGRAKRLLAKAARMPVNDGLQLLADNGLPGLFQRNRGAYICILNGTIELVDLLCVTMTLNSDEAVAIGQIFIENGLTPDEETHDEAYLSHMITSAGIN